MSLNAQVLMSIIAQESSTSNMASTMRSTPASYSVSLSHGTGANQSQLAWSAAGSVGGDTGEEFVIQALADDRGIVSMTSVKAIFIRNKSASSVLAVSVYGWTSLSPNLTPFFPRIPAGGAIAFVNPTAEGWTTGPSSTMNLISSAANQTVDYELVFIGEGTVS